MRVDLDWSGPLFPLPNWAIGETFSIQWDDDAQHYYGLTTPAEDQVGVFFNLDLSNGNYWTYLQAWRGAVNIMSISTAVETVEKGAYFSVQHNDWIALPFDHTCEATFSTHPS